MTNYVECADRLHKELVYILGDAEIRGHILSDQRLAAEAEEFGRDLVRVERKVDDFFRGIIQSANEEFSALTDAEQLDLFSASMCAVEGNWDYPFKRRAEELREGYVAGMRRVA